MTWKEIEKEFIERFVEPESTPARAITLNNAPLVMGKAKDVLNFIRQSLKQYEEAVNSVEEDSSYALGEIANKQTEFWGDGKKY